MIIAAAIIFVWPECWYMDPLCTYFFAIIVLYTTRVPFWQCVELILETKPAHLDSDKITQRLEQIKGVHEVHEMHIWALNNDKFCFNCHITLKEGQASR